VPADTRGVASGMRATFQNSATLVSIGLFFTIVVAGLAKTLPTTFYSGLTKYGVPASSAQAIAHLPPTSALFGAFLGYNPIGVLLPHAVQAALSPANRDALLSKAFFPNLIAGPFMAGLSAVFLLSTGMCIIAAIASLLRGRRYIHEATPDTPGPARTPALTEQPIT
jgi:hypothetical protein